LVVNELVNEVAVIGQPADGEEHHYHHEHTHHLSTYTCRVSKQLLSQRQLVSKLVGLPSQTRLAHH
jgi:hypothetical protein